MSNKFANRFCIAVLILVLSVLVACGGSLTVEEKSSIIIDPALADTYFSQALGVTPAELATAHQAFREARGITTTTTAFETFENEDVQYWSELLSLDSQKLLEAELETTNSLLMDAVEYDLITDDQWKMAVYTNVIDQSVFYPELWAEAVGLSTEEMDDFAQSGIGYGEIAARNNRELVDAFASIYTSHGDNMGLDLGLIPWDPEIFLNHYLPDEGECFEATFLPESGDQSDVSTPFEPVDQLSACPILTDNPKCDVQTCGHSEGGGGGSGGGTGSSGGTGGTGGAFGGHVGGVAGGTGGTGFIKNMEVKLYPANEPTHLNAGSYNNRNEIFCPDKYGRFLIEGISGENTITFYYDFDSDGILDTGEINHAPISINNQGGKKNAYACFTYYSNVKLKYAFSSPSHTHLLDMPRVDIDLINQ